MQKHVNLVDLVKSFPTNIHLQNLASIQKRTSPKMFAHLAEKSEKGSIPNLSTKMQTAEFASSPHAGPGGEADARSAKRATLSFGCIIRRRRLRIRFNLRMVACASSLVSSVSFNFLSRVKREHQADMSQTSQTS